MTAAAPEESADSDQLLTSEQVAELLQVPESTVGLWRQQGTGPAWLRIGKYVRYRREDVRVWVVAQVRGGAE